MTHTDAIRAALHALLTRAGVNPDDGSSEAARRIRAVLDTDGIEGEQSCPRDCRIASWLRKTVGDDGGDMLVTNESVLVKSHGEVPGAWGKVPLPRSIQAVIRGLDGASPAAGTVGVPCPKCGKERYVKRQNAAKIEKVKSQRCYSCAQLDRLKSRNKRGAA